MQFKTFHEFYKENKDRIVDYDKAYKEYNEMLTRFFEKINILKPSFSEKEIDKAIEELALTEFENVGDEGLFPNHTDRDIWVSGFRDGIKYIINKLNK